jgi:hypothetical protein
MVGNYIILAISICTIFICLFKLKNESIFRLLGVVMGIEGILISVAQLMRIQYILNYPIVLFGIISFIIMTYGVWKIRKIPEKKALAYTYLIGMPCLAIFALIMNFLIGSGMFGE